MKTFYQAIFLEVIFPFMLVAQIKGTVVDESGIPLSSVNIVLLNKGGNAITYGTASDGKGRFLMAPKAFKDTTAALGFSHIGYKGKLYEVKLLRGNVDIGKVTLIKTVTDLGEVIVSASRTITQVDKRIFFPQKYIVKNSTDGYTLLSYLMLSGLRVDIVQKKVSKNNGGNVAVYIDYKLASKADFLSLQPDEVLRVEYIDSSGVQYANDNVEAVRSQFCYETTLFRSCCRANTTNAVNTGKGENGIPVVGIN